MKIGRQSIPAQYAYLQESCHQVETRASLGLYNFLTGNSVLTLAWATIYAGSTSVAIAKCVVMAGISVVGVALGMQWALLGVRTWHISLEYGDQLRAIWSHHGMRHEAVDKVMGAHWSQRDFLFSANPWVLFLVPLAFSALHMVMLTVAMLESSSPLWPAIVAWIIFLIYACKVYGQCWAPLWRPRRGVPQGEDRPSLFGRFAIRLVRSD